MQSEYNHSDVFVVVVYTEPELSIGQHLTAATRQILDWLLNHLDMRDVFRGYCWTGAMLIGSLLSWPYIEDYVSEMGLYYWFNSLETASRSSDDASFWMAALPFMFFGLGIAAWALGLTAYIKNRAELAYLDDDYQPLNSRTNREVHSFLAGAESVLKWTCYSLLAFIYLLMLMSGLGQGQTSHMREAMDDANWYLYEQPLSQTPGGIPFEVNPN